MTRDHRRHPRSTTPPVETLDQREAREIAEIVIDARKRAGMTQSDVARAMGTTQSVVAKLESGTSMPSTSNLQRFARATGSYLRLSLDPITIHERLKARTPMSQTTDLRNPSIFMQYMASRRKLLGSTAGAAVAGSLLTHAGAQTPATSPAASPAADGDTTITTPLGTYDIPRNPQRVITIDSRLDLEPAVALDLSLIATSYNAPEAWVPAPADLTLLAPPVDIEAVAALEPDLIICVNLDSEWWPAPTLNNIAPVLTTEFMAHWRTNLEQIATWLDRSDALTDVLADYDPIVADFQARHADALAERQIAYIQFDPATGVINYNVDAFIQWQVAEDLGVTLFNGKKSVEESALSTERLIDLAEVDGFLVQDYGTEDGSTAFTHLSEDPLWQTLPAVQAGAVVATTGNTNYGSIYTAKEVIRLYDELFTKMT